MDFSILRGQIYCPYVYRGAFGYTTVDIKFCVSSPYDSLYPAVPPPPPPPPVSLMFTFDLNTEQTTTNNTAPPARKVPGVFCSNSYNTILVLSAYFSQFLSNSLLLSSPPDPFFLHGSRQRFGTLNQASVCRLTRRSPHGSQPIRARQWRRWYREAGHQRVGVTLQADTQSHIGECESQLWCLKSDSGCEIASGATTCVF